MQWNSKRKLQFYELSSLTKGKEQARGRGDVANLLRRVLIAKSSQNQSLSHKAEQCTPWTQRVTIKLCAIPSTLPLPPPATLPPCMLSGKRRKPDAAGNPCRHFSLVTYASLQTRLTDSTRCLPYLPPFLSSLSLPFPQRTTCSALFFSVPLLLLLLLLLLLWPLLCHVLWLVVTTH